MVNCIMKEMHKDLHVCQLILENSFIKLITKTSQKIHEQCRFKLVHLLNLLPNLGTLHAKNSHETILSTKIMRQEYTRRQNA